MHVARGEGKEEIKQNADDVCRRWSRGRFAYITVRNARVTRLSFALTRSRTINAMFLSYRKFRPRSFITALAPSPRPSTFRLRFSILNFRRISKYVVASGNATLVFWHRTVPGNIVYFSRNEKLAASPPFSCLPKVDDRPSFYSAIFHAFVKSRVYFYYLVIFRIIFEGGIIREEILPLTG